MVTRVLDAQGNVLHDCTVLGCTVSWDGYALTNVTVPGSNPTVVAVAKGSLLPGATAPDPKLWSVNGNTATAVAATVTAGQAAA